MVSGEYCDGLRRVLRWSTESTAMGRGEYCDGAGATYPVRDVKIFRKKVNISSMRANIFRRECQPFPYEK